MFPTFPEYPIKRIAIKVKTPVERLIRKRHPWVFEGAIVKQSAEGNAGDLAIIYDQKKNKFLALGLYDSDSPIRIKLLQYQKSTAINEAWFEQKIKQAYQIRQSLLTQTNTNSYRLVHGENDGLPSFIVDVYADVLVVKLYSAIWLPYLKLMLPILQTVTKAKTIVLRMSRSLQNMTQKLHGLEDGQVVYGELKQEEVIFIEHGLYFSANVVHGHKTGYFLDHRHNRQKVGQLAKNKRVLDIFAYAGGFSVHALAGGASEVVSLDISKQALEMAKKNVALNSQLQSNKHKIMAVDAFEGLQQLKRQKKLFDIVVVDPPSFAKRDSERARALRKYAQLCELAIPLVSKGGILLMASCSSRVSADDFFAVVLKTLQSSRRRFRELERTFHDIDHPIGFEEGKYLKAMYIEIS
ncbi:MAG: class I SAM-dependent rRNA methyltransferase [Chitinophagales bacterium]